jgi:hypothetical protein
VKTVVIEQHPKGYKLQHNKGDKRKIPAKKSKDVKHGERLLAISY